MKVSIREFFEGALLVTLTIVFYVGLFLLLLRAFILNTVAYGAEIDEDTAVYCVMGEARGEGYDGMLACSEAIRNRGTLKGVYGCQAKFTEPQWVWDQARKAWRTSAHTNTVGGAQYWASLKVDQAWIKRMEKAGFVHTLTVKNTAFYKEG